MTSEDTAPSSAPIVKSGWTPLELLIWRSRWVIATGTLVCVFVAGLVTVMAPPVYRARAAIDPGDFRDEGRDIERLVARAAAGGLFAMPRPQSSDYALSAEIRPPGLIEVVATARTAEAAVSAVRGPTEAVLAEINRLMEIQRDKHARTRRLAEELRAGVQRMRTVLGALGQSAKTPAENVAFSNLLTQFVANEARLIELDTQVGLQESRRAGPRIVSAASAEKVSIRRRLGVNLAIALLLGFVASLAFAVALQYLGSGGRGWRSTAGRG